MLKGLAQHFPIHLPVVDRNTPFFLDVTLFNRVEEELPSESVVKLKYRDVAGNEYVLCILFQASAKGSSESNSNWN